MIGEHVGQLFMGVWTVLVSVLLVRTHAPKPVSAAGFLSGALFLLGLGAGLARSVPMPAFVQTLPLLAFIAWSLWAIATGLTLARGWFSTTMLTSSDSPTSGAVAAPSAR